MQNEMEAILKTAGYSVTPARRQLYKLLRTSSPISAQSVLKQLKNADRATVYRNLKLFESIGVIHRISTSSGHKLELAGPFHNHPHHLVCENCGLNIPLPDDPRLEKNILRLTEAQGFSTKEHYLEIVGRCANC